MRDDCRVSLDGAWDFQIDLGNTSDATPQGEWRSVIVPMPWQAQFEDLRNTSGVAWYRCHFTVDRAAFLSATETAAILHFGAVDYHATVWVNGRPVGKHEGGFLPFEFDIIDLLCKGDNELLVKVVDATDDRHRYADFPFSEVPHGKQSWYGPISGIWQSVWLEFRPKLHLAQVRLDPSPDDAAIGVQVVLSGTPQDAYEVVCSVTAPDGQTVGTGVLEQDLTGVIRLDSFPHLWSPNEPNLYAVTATLHVSGNPTYSVQKTCGFRTIEARNGRIYLNGNPIYLRGVLDQGYYPETIYTPASLELLEAQARSAKVLGFNCLRIHIKVEDPRYYEVADRLGLLVWTEIPNWTLLTDASVKRAKLTFDGMVERDGHHPSIIAWTLVNENWGTDLARNVEHRRWLAEFYRYAKSIDPTRLVIDNSACGGNAHVASDLEDFHNYRAIPDHAYKWDEWAAEFAKRSDWAWFPDFAHERRADLPLLVSELGNWGLPDPGVIQEHGAEPWWFETGFEWDGGIVYPHGVKHRYEACGLADIFPSYAEFSRHAQEHMARSLHYEISTMRLHDAIAGYIVTEFTDVHWECNGLLTMQRQPKHLLDPLLKDLNQDRVVVLRPLQWSGHPGEALGIMVQTMGVEGQQKGGRVVWQAGTQTGELPAPGGNLSLVLDRPGVVTLSAKWLAEDGTRLATNQVDLVCVFTEPESAKLRVIGNAAIANSLRNLGYHVSEGDASGAAGEIVVACCYTSALEAHVQSGGRLLLLAEPTIPDGSDDGVELPVGYIVPRAGSVWLGDWANSIAWVKKQGPLAHLPGGPLLEMEWANLMPDAVLAGLPSWVQRSHSWAGLVVGWVHKPVSLLTVMPYGRGHILITTFKLNAATLATEAIAQALFAGMLDLLLCAA
ncbi:MAG: sugar-binding domain-containing protein [Chloroflexota bacterium]